MSTRETASTGFASKPHTCQPGCLRLLSWLMATFGCGNDGCYNPTSYLEPSHTPSWHVYGKAIDAAANYNDATQKHIGDAVWGWTYANRESLNLQQMIWGPTIYDVSDGIQAYHHTDHYNHVHIAVGFDASQNWQPPAEGNTVLTDAQVKLLFATIGDLHKEIAEVKDIAGWCFNGLSEVPYEKRDLSRLILPKVEAALKIPRG